MASHFCPVNNLGNSAPNEKQLPPEKRYRAALLKNRFADLILKAREKTFNQVSCVCGAETCYSGPFSDFGNYLLNIAQ